MKRAESSRLLLISNSIQHGRGFLDHVEPEMRDFLPPLKEFSSYPSRCSIATPMRRRSLLG